MGCDAFSVRCCAELRLTLERHGLQSARLLCPWGFSRQEHWSGLPCPPPGDLPNPGIESRPPTLQVDSLLSEPPWKPLFQYASSNFKAWLYSGTSYTCCCHKLPTIKAGWKRTRKRPGLCMEQRIFPTFVASRVYKNGRPKWGSLFLLIHRAET